MNSQPAIEAVELVKRYGSTAVVDRVSLSLDRGRILGLLGPNGAGKTTVVRILTTLLRADGGLARICGYDVARQPHEARQMIGLTGQNASVDPDLSGWQNLVMVGRLLGLQRQAARSRADELLDDVGLTEAGRKPTKTYSGGMRRRLDLAMSVVNRPAVVFFDEPTTGLDPAGRGDTWAMIRRLADNGSGVLLTTQYLEEADRLADDIVILAAAAVVAQGTPDALKRRLGTQRIDLQVREPAMVSTAVEQITMLLDTIPTVDMQTRRLTVPIRTTDAMPAVVRTLDYAGVGIEELQLRLPSLDDVFLTLTGQPTVDADTVDAHTVDADATTTEGSAA